MSTNTHQVNIKGIDIYIYLSNSLGSISMEKDLLLSAESPDFFHILPDSNLVVHKNNTNTKYLFLRLLNSFSQQIDIQNASFIHRQVANFVALKF